GVADEAQQLRGPAAPGRLEVELLDHALSHQLTGQLGDGGGADVQLAGDLAAAEGPDRAQQGEDRRTGEVSAVAAGHVLTFFSNKVSAENMKARNVPVNPSKPPGAGHANGP